MAGGIGSGRFNLASGGSDTPDMRDALDGLATGPITVLMVETDTAEDGGIRVALESQDSSCLVTVAASIEEAMSYVARQRTDVLLLAADVLVGEGLDQSLRALYDVGRRVPIVLLVDTPDTPLAPWTLETGARRVVYRLPSARAELLSTVRSAALDGRRSAGRADYHGLFQRASQAIYRTDHKGKLTDVNAALVEMLGYESKQAVLGLRLAIDVFLDPKTHARFMSRAEELGWLSDEEVVWGRADGTPRTIRLSGRLVVEADGSAGGFEGIAEDITDRKALEEQYRQSQKMEAIGQLTGGIAHEINNILSVIMTDAQFVEHDLPLEYEALAGDVAEIRQMAIRGGILVKKLLGFSRRQRLTLELLDLQTVVLDSAGVLGRLVPEFIRVEADDLGEVCLARVDRSTIEQILFNLTTNARDAMPGGGTITVSVTCLSLDEAFCVAYPGAEAGDYVCLRVVDTGIGMNKQTQRSVFEPFFTTKPKGQGTGLGMAMVYGLVKQQGGFIAIKSQPGQGTSVSVFFPQIKGAVPEVRPSGARPPVQRGEGTILLVEDEAALRRAGRRALERLGYRVLVAADGVEGIAAFRRYQDEISVVVTDVVMPRMNGPAMIEALRRLGHEPPFILTSGYGSNELRKGVLPHGAAIHVDKPWNFDELLQVIHDVCEGRSVSRVASAEASGARGAVS